VNQLRDLVEAAAAVRYAKSDSGSHAAVIRVYDNAGNVIQTHEHKGDFKEAWAWCVTPAIEAVVSESIGLRLAISG
jgi:hypothetical protein